MAEHSGPSLVRLSSPIDVVDSRPSMKDIVDDCRIGPHCRHCSSQLVEEVERWDGRDKKLFTAGLPNHPRVSALFMGKVQTSRVLMMESKPKVQNRLHLLANWANCCIHDPSYPHCTKHVHIWVPNCGGYSTGRYCLNTPEKERS